MNQEQRTPDRLPDDARLRHAPGVRLRERGGVHVLLGADETEPQSLSPMALALWELCDGETTVGEMIRACLAVFDAPAELVRADIGAALTALVETGLLVREG